MMTLETIYKSLSDEQKASARACKTPEDIIALAQAEGFELSDEELESISGGAKWNECEQDTVNGPY